MRRRAGGPEPAPVRLAAWVEAAALRRWERRLARSVVVQAAISPVDARELPAPPPVHVLPNRVELRAAARGAEPLRDIDVVLTGNMAYPPNADAARWLSEAIAPALWRRRPDASVWVVGRAAQRLVARPANRGARRRRRHRRATCGARAWRSRRCASAPAPRTRCSRRWPPAPRSWRPRRRWRRSRCRPAPWRPRTDAEALAAAVHRLLADENERRRLAERAADAVARFGVVAQREQVDRLVRRAARGGPWLSGSSGSPVRPASAPPSGAPCRGSAGCSRGPATRARPDR